MKIDVDFFSLVIPDSTREAVDFAPWLLNAGRAHDKVAVCVRDGKLFFATAKEVWACPTEGEMFLAVLAGFRHQAIDIPQISLVMRDLYQDMLDFIALAAEPLGFTPLELFTRLAPLCEGDLSSAAMTAGWPVEGHDRYTDGAHDAYATVVHEEQFALGAARYYSALGVPFAKLQAEATLAGMPAAQWVMSYDDLWLRVAVHFTGDPTLKYALTEGNNVWMAAAKALNTNQTIARALLIWQIYGRDMNLLQRVVPDIIQDLPTDLPLWGVRVDKGLPAFAAGIAQIQNAYWQNRKATTRYGRILRPGAQPGEASAFVIFGTVEDLVANAAVSAWNSRTSNDIFITRISANPLDEVVRVGGTMPKQGEDQWRYVIRDLMPLANPLTSGPLRPTYIEL